jgi:hypothetical protein
MATKNRTKQSDPERAKLLEKIKNDFEQRLARLAARRSGRICS